MLHKLLRLGLHQRILCLLIGGAVATAAVVGWSVQELSLLRGYIEQERQAERRSEAVHEAMTLAYRAASHFAALGLDLTPEEKVANLAEGEALLLRFRVMQSVIRPILQTRLDPEEQDALNGIVNYINHSWTEAKQTLAPEQRDELQFHLIAIVKQTERVHELIAKANDIARKEATDAKLASDARVATAIPRILATMIAGLALVLVGGWLLLHLAVKRPLNAVIATITRIARGDIESPVPRSARSDEIGAIFSALAVFRENSIARKRLEQDLTESIAQGEARRQALESNIAEFRAAVRAVLDESAKALDVMQASARELSAAAAETEAEASKTTGASQEVSSNVGGVAAATRQLSAGTGSMAISLGRAESAIEQAASRASVASATIDSLSEVAQTIEDVTQFIDSIAQQTNLLALNATIEAARAGESGRGFAVVAAEVKTLATQTAKATTDIALRIEEMRRCTAGVVEAMRVITETTSEANAHAASITAVVTQQNEVTASISKSIQDAAGWTAGLSQVVDELACAVARTRSAAQKVEIASRETNSAAGKFNHLVDAFLHKVAAG
ncbi:MAG TPA: methyl-accepting chemotaxis protein [Xanthobacteraceae bacterium]|nr:methyl-accepting chemotaxis protein [Xanthobacteraceae bacterium]